MLTNNTNSFLIMNMLKFQIFIITSHYFFFHFYTSSLNTVFVFALLLLNIYICIWVYPCIHTEIHIIYKFKKLGMYMKREKDMLDCAPKKM